MTSRLPRDPVRRLCRRGAMAVNASDAALTGLATARTGSTGRAAAPIREDLMKRTSREAALLTITCRWGAVHAAVSRGCRIGPCARATR